MFRPRALRPPLPRTVLAARRFMHGSNTTIATTIRHSNATLTLTRSSSSRRCFSIDNISKRTRGELGQTSFQLFLVDRRTGRELSPWHHIPLFSHSQTSPSSVGSSSPPLLVHMVAEIPRGDRLKMEVSTGRVHNPIMQDVKHGRPRLFTFGDLPFNYGCLPQTWEDPDRGHSDLPPELRGDNDPVDVVELSAGPLEMGGVYEVRLLGCLALIDEGEIDWKVLAIRTQGDDVGAAGPRTLRELQERDPQAIERVVHWFRFYKTTDGKPENSFGLGGQVMDERYARDVVLETHDHWRQLLARRGASASACHERLYIPSLPEQQMYIPETEAAQKAQEAGAHRRHS